MVESFYTLFGNKVNSANIATLTEKLSLISLEVNRTEGDIDLGKATLVLHRTLASNKPEEGPIYTYTPQVKVSGSN